MLIALLLLLSPGAAGAPTAAPSTASDPPVRVWFSSGGDYAYGDRAKVYARAAADGYLVVLHADASGRVRVLFPIEPGGEHQVRGGKKYELKGRGGREAFVVDDSSGRGEVLAAFSRTPFHLDQVEKNGHWDYALLADQLVKDDPEAGLMDLVQRMQQGGEHFDYDAATYLVSTPQYAWPGWWDYGYGARFWYGPGYYSGPFYPGGFYPGGFYRRGFYRRGLWYY